MSTESNPTQSVTFDVKTTADISGLHQTLTKLKEIDALWDTMRAKFAGRASPRSAQDFASGMQKGKAGLVVHDLAKEFGFDPNGIREAGMKTQREIRKQMDAIRSAVAQGKRSEASAATKLAELESQMPFADQAGKAFRTKESAARVLADYDRAQVQEYRKWYRGLAGAGLGVQSGGPVGDPPTIPGNKVAAGVDGMVPLSVPHTQIDAKVTGIVELGVPASQIHATVLPGDGKPGTAPTTGKHIAEQFPLPMEGGASGGAGPAPARGRGGPLKEFRHKLDLERLERERLLALDGKDPFARSGTLAKGAQQLRAVLHSPEAKALAPEEFGRQSQKVEALARKLEAQSKAALGAGQVGIADHAGKAQDQLARETQALADARRTEADELTRSARRGSDMSKRIGAIFDGQQTAVQSARTPPLLVPPKLTAAPRSGLGGFVDSVYGDDGRLVTNGLKGFTPAGFAKNVLTVGGWSAAVGALYAGVGVVKSSVQTFAELERATRRLDQVFRGGGGSARQLADDVLALGAANGRSSKEAMDSAIAWSRTGMNRVQVNEAVRVSLMAANVAEMDAAEATESLSAVMTSYGLNAGDLGKVLGMVNHTSNTLRVTNKDLFEGLARTSAVARQAQLPLEKLIPILGTAVGATGQTGNQFGNAMKTVLVRLGTPELQSFLRSKPIGIETTAPGGAMRGAEDILAEAATRFKSLSGQDQARLVSKWGSATQANRLITFFQQWNHSMTQAAENLQNLDSAEKENALITGSLSSRWQGLVTAWDRMVMAEGSGPISMVGDKIKGWSNALTAVADINGSDSGPSRVFWDFMRTLNMPLHPQDSPMYQRMVKQHPNWDVASRMSRWWHGGKTPGEMQAEVQRKQQADLLSDITSEEAGQQYLNLLGQSRGRFRSGGAADALAFNRSMAITALGGDISLSPQHQAQLRGLANPQLTTLARLTDRRSIAGMAARESAAGMAFGSSPGEQLLNQQSGLIRELSALGQDRELSDNDIVRQLTLQLQLLENQEAIQTRIAQVETERRQIQIDSNREFQQKLLTAGPQDLLRMGAVNEMWRRGKIGAHNFFALSPEARAEARMLSGGEAMEQNRYDARLLGPPKTIEERQFTYESITNDLIQFRERLAQGEEQAVARSVQMYGAAQAGLDRVGRSSHLAADGLERLAATLHELTAAPAELPPQSTGAAPGAKPIGNSVRDRYTVG